MTIPLPGMTISHKPKKMIGIIGGSGPEAGINVMEKILKMQRELLGKQYQSDKDAPYVVLMQVPGVGGPHGMWDMEDKESAAYAYLWDNITDTIEKLMLIGCECFCLTCNTLHVLEPAIREWMTAQGHDEKRFVSIVESTKDDIVEQYLQRMLEVPQSSQGEEEQKEEEKNEEAEEKVAKEDDDESKGNQVCILGSYVTTGVTDRSPYKSLCDGNELEFVQLEVELREEIQNFINQTKAMGPQEAIKEDFYQRVMVPLCKKRTIGNVKPSHIVLGCTELPLLVDAERAEKIREEFDVKCVDPNNVLASTLLKNAGYMGEGRCYGRSVRAAMGEKHRFTNASTRSMVTSVGGATDDEGDNTTDFDGTDFDGTDVSDVDVPSIKLTPSTALAVIEEHAAAVVA